MADDPLRIKVSEEPRRRRGRPKSPRAGSRARIALAWGSAAASTALVVGYLLLRSGAPPAGPDAAATANVAASREAASAENVAPAQADRDAAADAAATADAEVVVRDDGRLLWQSPTAGPPISRQWTPAGTQAVLHLRPADIAANPDGAKALAALGPWGEHAKDFVEQLFGIPLVDIDSLLVAVAPDAEDRLQFAVRASSDDFLVNPPPIVGGAGSLPSGWSGFGFAEADGQTPAYVACSTSLVEQLQAQTEPPPLDGDLEQLFAASDSQRDVTLIVQPRFLQASGNRLLAGDAEPLRTALRILTDDRAAAVALSWHWDADFFVELRAAPVRNSPPQPYSGQLQRQLAAAANSLEEIVAAAPWAPYGRKVLIRLPAMVRAAARYARHGVDAGQAVVRCYLPAAAGHNLLMGAELLLTQSTTAGAASDAATPDAVAAAPQTIEQKLQTITSLSFPKDSLQQALELLSGDIGVPIEILGGDLQLDGITKNQSFGIDLRDRPAAEILLEVLLRANPDRTATGPADPKQKLVYAIRPGANGQPGRIVVTTRAAAAKRREPLPGIFSD
ncbi:MAG: hypothetical protein KDA44_05400 [Planctomycetales bacterium]|nr:hypothetical protein [Planctomycetales bacterium]